MHSLRVKSHGHTVTPGGQACHLVFHWHGWGFQDPNPEPFHQDLRIPEVATCTTVPIWGSQKQVNHHIITPGSPITGKTVSRDRVQRLHRTLCCDQKKGKDFLLLKQSNPNHDNMKYIVTCQWHKTQIPIFSWISLSRRQFLHNLSSLCI